MCTFREQFHSMWVCDSIQGKEYEMRFPFHHNAMKDVVVHVVAKQSQGFILAKAVDMDKLQHGNGKNTLKSLSLKAFIVALMGGLGGFFQQAPHPNSSLPAEISFGRDCSGGKLMANLFDRSTSNL